MNSTHEHGEKTHRFLPENDGVDHINVYSKGRTKLGQQLSNFAHTPFTWQGTQYASVEAWWYCSSLRTYGVPEADLAPITRLYGYKAKQAGQLAHERLGVKTAPHKADELLEVYRTKLDAHPDLRQALLNNTLPFDHYYVDAAGKRQDTFWAWTGTLWSKVLAPVRRAIQEAQPARAANEQSARPAPARAAGKRTLFLDTETTGLYPDHGHRVIEIACVEAVEGRLTGGEYHIYLNPERAIDRTAQAVHGLSEQFLRDKPLFYDVAEEFIDYIRDAELVIHNAPFDVGFLDSELAMAGKDGLKAHCGEIFDTLEMAREMHPGCPNKLDALCDRYRVDRSMRDKHGALVDTRILADVFREMMAARRFMEREMAATLAPSASVVAENQRARGADITLRTISASPEELAAHEAALAEIQAESKGCGLAWN